MSSHPSCFLIHSLHFLVHPKPLRNSPKIHSILRSYYSNQISCIWESFIHALHLYAWASPHISQLTCRSSQYQSQHYLMTPLTTPLPHHHSLIQDQESFILSLLLILWHALKHSKFPHVFVNPFAFTKSHAPKPTVIYSLVFWSKILPFENFLLCQWISISTQGSHFAACCCQQGCHF